MNDLKFALRQLLKSPAFTAVAMLTLAICVGANVTILAVVDSILLRSLPCPDPDRLVTTINAYPKAGVPRAGSSLPNYYDRREAISAFEKTAAIRGGMAIVGDEGSPQRVPIESVSPEFFATLGIVPARGRFFTEEETEYTRSRVVVLTDSYWRAHFNADSNVIGQEMRVDALKTTVVGVLPPGFRYLSSRALLFVPLASNADERDVQQRHGNNLEIVARLKRGTTLATAQGQIDALNAQQIANDPFAEMVKGAGYRTDVLPLHADHVRQIRATLLLLLGALPGQIHRQFLRVGAGLLVAGLAFGSAGAWGVIRAMRSELFEVGPMPAGALAIAAAVMAVVVLLASWLPARRAAQVDPMEALRHE